MSSNGKPMLIARNMVLMFSCSNFSRYVLRNAEILMGEFFTILIHTSMKLSRKALSRSSVEYGGVSLDSFSPYIVERSSVISSVKLLLSVRRCSFSLLSRLLRSTPILTRTLEYNCSWLKLLFSPELHQKRYLQLYQNVFPRLLLIR